MREYIKVYCCGDCIQYNMKKHRCKLGATDEGTGRESFYRDCPLGICTETDSPNEFDRMLKQLLSEASLPPTASTKSMDKEMFSAQAFERLVARVKLLAEEPPTEDIFISFGGK